MSCMAAVTWGGGGGGSRPQLLQPTRFRTFHNEVDVPVTLSVGNSYFLF